MGSEGRFSVPRTIAIWHGQGCGQLRQCSGRFSVLRRPVVWGEQWAEEFEQVSSEVEALVSWDCVCLECEGRGCYEMGL